MTPGKRPEPPQLEREYNTRDPHDALRFIKAMVARAAFHASEVMQDHLLDDDVVRHMHDAIGALAAIRDAANLQLPMNDEDGPDRPRMWGRLTNPLAKVKKVRTVPGYGGAGEVWESMDSEGHYWRSSMYPNGIAWDVLLGWGPLEEAR